MRLAILSILALAYSGVAATFVANPGARGETNAQRMSRGLSPLKPRFHNNPGHGGATPALGARHSSPSGGVCRHKLCCKDLTVAGDVTGSTGDLVALLGIRADVAVGLECAAWDGQCVSTPLCCHREYNNGELATACVTLHVTGS